MVTKQDDKPVQNAPAPAPAPLATVQPGPLAHAEAAPSAAEGLSRVRLEPRNFPEMLASAEIAYALRLGKVESVKDAAARIMRGATLGLDAMTSCEQIYVVGDRTGMYARLMHAIVLRSPLCAELAIVEEACNDQVAIVRARRRGAQASKEYKFTAEEAKKLVGDKFEKKDSSWVTDRKGMLISKALGRACYREWPDVLMGFVTVEDLRDIVDHDPATGETKVTTAPSVNVQTRDFEVELAGIVKALHEAESDAQFKTERRAIEQWTAPESFKHRAQAEYNETRSAWKSDGLSKVARAKSGEAKS